MTLAHGRAETITYPDREIGALRAEIGQLTALVEKLLEEVAALRDGGGKRARRAPKRKE